MLWLGRPRCDLLFVPYDAILIPFGIVSSIAVALFVRSGLETGLDVLLTAAWMIAALMVFLRFPLDIYTRKNTFYFVTNQRVAIKRNTVLDRTCRSVELTRDFQMTPLDGPNDTTTIYFGPTNSIFDFHYPANYVFSDLVQPPSFAFLDNAGPVMDLILEARRQLASSR